MSFMIIQCAWCGETYSFGVVGTSQIGSGHACKATVECAHEGCSKRATRQVSRDEFYSLSGPFTLRCPEHVDGPVIGWQPGVTT